jgi:hypothetical protein
MDPEAQGGLKLLTRRRSAKLGSCRPELAGTLTEDETVSSTCNVSLYEYRYGLSN